MTKLCTPVSNLRQGTSLTSFTKIKKIVKYLRTHSSLKSLSKIACFQDNPTHCVHMNLVTKRLWCYECTREVFLEPPLQTTTNNTIIYDSDQEMEGCTYRSRDSGHGSYSTLRTSTPERGNVFAFERTVTLII